MSGYTPDSAFYRLWKNLVSLHPSNAAGCRPPFILNVIPEAEFAFFKPVTGGVVVIPDQSFPGVAVFALRTDALPHEGIGGVFDAPLAFFQLLLVPGSTLRSSDLDFGWAILTPFRKIFYNRNGSGTGLNNWTGNTGLSAYKSTCMNSRSA